MGRVGHADGLPKERRGYSQVRRASLLECDDHVRANFGVRRLAAEAGHGTLLQRLRLLADGEGEGFTETPLGRDVATVGSENRFALQSVELGQVPVLSRLLGHRERFGQ